MKKEIKVKQIKQREEYYPELDNAFKTLKLNKKATLLDLKNAYRKLAFKYHPDRCKKNRKSLCKEKFIEINNARKLLENHLTGNYKHVSSVYRERAMEEKMKIYKDHVDHIKRFYDEWFGGLNF